MGYSKLNDDIHVYNILINSASKEGIHGIGNVLLVELIVKGIEPNVSTFIRIISSFCMDALPKKANEVFYTMEQKGCPPNQVTFNVILQGFIRNKLFDEIEVVTTKMVSKGFCIDVFSLQLLFDSMAAGSLDRSLLDLINKLVSKELLDHPCFGLSQKDQRGYVIMQGLKRGTSVIRHFSVPQIRRKVFNSWSAVEDTFLSTKDTFERHKVVFTILTSMASIGTAWAGYTLRHLHETKVEHRLDSIENAMRKNYDLEGKEFKKLVGTGSSNIAACVATAGVSLVVGYGLGWRGGRWYANRKFKREQMKLLGQVKPKRWQLKFLRRPMMIRLKKSVKAPETEQNSIPIAHNPREANPA